MLHTAHLHTHRVEVPDEQADDHGEGIARQVHRQLHVGLPALLLARRLQRGGGGGAAAGGGCLHGWCSLLSRGAASEHWMSQC